MEGFTNLNANAVGHRGGEKTIGPHNINSGSLLDASLIEVNLGTDGHRASRTETDH